MEYNRSAALEQSKVTTKIPRLMYQEIRLPIEGSAFSPPSDFIVHALRDLVGRRGLEGRGDELSADEVRTIQSRLRNPGYLG